MPRKDFFIWQDDREYGLRAGKETKIEFVKDAILLHNEKRDHNGLIPVWKNYYGFRNGIVLRQLYAKDKKAAKSYALKQLLRHVPAVLIKKDIRESERFIFNHILTVIKMVTPEIWVRTKNFTWNVDSFRRIIVTNSNPLFFIEEETR